MRIARILFLVSLSNQGAVKTQTHSLGNGFLALYSSSHLPRSPLGFPE